MGGVVVTVDIAAMPNFAFETVDSEVHVAFVGNRTGRWALNRGCHRRDKRRHVVHVWNNGFVIFIHMSPQRILRPLFNRQSCERITRAKVSEPYFRGNPQDLKFEEIETRDFHAIVM
jgi:hypothetical protein